MDGTFLWTANNGEWNEDGRVKIFCRQHVDMVIFLTSSTVLWEPRYDPSPPRTNI